MKNNEDNQNVIINFDYKSQLVTIKTNSFKKLLDIKKMAIKKINIQNNSNLKDLKLDCYYLGRNLKDYEQQKICELFSNREIISIKLKTPKKNLTIDNTSNNTNIKDNNISTTPNASPIRGKNYFANFFKNTNIFSSGFNSINRIKKDKNSVNSVMYQIFTERLKHKISLPMINSKNDSASLNMANKSALDENYYIPTKKEQYNSSKGIGTMCPKCNENYINEYCRTCNEFICSDCKDNYNHKNHLSIHLIRGDLKDNINLYGNLVQTDIEENINNNNELRKKEKIIEIIDQNILIGKNEELIHKLESLIKMYQNILDILKNNFTKELKMKMNSLIENFEKDGNEMNEEINKLLNNLNSQFKKKFDFNELKSYFDKINNYEFKLTEFNQDLIKYHLSFKINSKINNLYLKINKLLDKAVDIKNLFNLEPKYYNELIKLINFDKNKNGFNKRNYKTNKFLDLKFLGDFTDDEIKKDSFDSSEKDKK